MAVNLTVAQLAAALRLGDSAEETAEATRLLAYASEAVVKQAPGATDTAHDEAAVRLAGYLFDQPNAGPWYVIRPCRPKFGRVGDSSTVPDSPARIDRRSDSGRTTGGRHSRKS